MQAAGFEQYEVSGYARAGARCAHNLNYWTFGDYLGIGAGAHGKISDASRELVVRTQHTREPRRYLAADPAALQKRPIAVRDLPFEFAMNGFRLVEGFAEELFAGSTGLAHWRPGAGAGAAGRARTGGAGARDTGAQPPKGFRFLNEILVALLPETEAVPVT